jgi:hypothetical protein
MQSVSGTSEMQRLAASRIRVGSPMPTKPANLKAVVRLDEEQIREAVVEYLRVRGYAATAADVEFFDNRGNIFCLHATVSVFPTSGGLR